MAALGEFSAATIHEAQGRKGALAHRLKPVDPAMSFCGPAFTAQAQAGTTSWSRSPSPTPGPVTS
ncbi:hypothetical protein NKH77_07990 [Streptomyces sp. M19]